MKPWYKNIKSVLLKGSVLGGVGCCCVLLLLIFLYLGAIRPQTEQVLRFFESSDKITERPFAFRSKEHMLNALELLIAGNTSVDEVAYELDMAYALLNFGSYLSTYPCTNETLQHLDTLNGEVINQSDNTPLSPSTYGKHLFAAIDCTSSIEAQQEHHRSVLVGELLDKTNAYHDFVYRGVVGSVFAVIFFGLFYMAQARIIIEEKETSQRWKDNARRDGLTGVLNRRAMVDDLPNYIEHHRTNNKPFVLLMCDIDYFKKYNDHWGHLEGDLALKRVVGALNMALRHDDNLYRYGGEELVVTLHEMDIEQGKKIAQRLLTLVQELNLRNPGTPCGVLTMSIGCTEVYAEKIKPHQLLKRADKCMYQAKNSGRNCLVCC